MRIALTLLFYSLTFGLCLLCFWVWYEPYAVAFEQVIMFLDIPDKRVQLASQILPEARYTQIRLVLSVLACLSLISLYYLYFVIRWFLGKCVVIFNFLRLVYIRTQASWRTLFTIQKTITIIVSLAGLLPILWCVFVYEYWVDEVFSYVFLVKRGLLVCLTYYPGPNNHVFFTAVASLFGWVGEPLMAMRLLAFMGVLLTGLLLFSWLLVRKSWGVSCVALFIFLFQSPVQLYGYLGRGYAWEMLFFLILWIALWEWVRYPRAIYLGIASLSAVLGFYTLPTFLYAYLPLIFVACLPLPLLKTKNLLLAQLLVFVVVLCLYMPIILLNGWQALAGNAWLLVGKAQFWREFLSGQYWTEIVGFWGFDLPIWAGWVVLMLCLWLSSQADKALQYSLWALFTLPAVLLLYQQILPPVRVWSYMSVAIAMVIATKYEARNIMYRWVIICFCLLLSINFAFYWSFFPKKPAHATIAAMIYAVKAKKVFANEDTYQMFVRYEYAKRNREIAIQVFCVGKVEEKFDVLILYKKQKIPACISISAYKKAFENEEVTVFYWNLPAK